MTVTDEMVEAACRVWHDQFDADGLTNLIAMRAALEAALAAAPACPHIRSTGEGTHYCALAAAPQGEPVGHLHSTGDFCAERVVTSDTWPVPLYEHPPAPAAPQWIACSERMPKPGDEVLIWDGIDVCKAFRSHSRWWSDEHVWDGNDVSHWMPLPAAPGSEG